MMIVFFESIHTNMWDVVEKGNHIPLDAQKNKIVYLEQIQTTS